MGFHFHRFLTSLTCKGRRAGVVLCSLIVLGGTLCSCSSDDDEDTSEYHDWQQRNLAYFDSIRATSLDSIKLAKKLYGDSWQEHSNWRTYLSFSLDESVANTSLDSIYVQILKRGTGTESPLGTDSCRVFYRGRLIPSATYPEGYVFSHSGQSSIYEDIFNRYLSVPTIKKATSFVRGFSTALLYMHIGDRWRVYMSHQLGYGKTSDTTIPAYSDLVFEIELVSFYRNGTVVPPWN